MNQLISVIVPIFNISERFNQNLDILGRKLQESFENLEIIVVDDGSRNKFQPSFKHLNRNIKFLRYEENKGKGHALKYGFSHSRGELVVFIDGDMELHPKDIKNFVSLMEIYGVDVVIGSKRHPYSEVSYPWYRRILSWCYQIFIRIFLNLSGVRDSQVGLKLFRREVLEAAMEKVVVKKYAFDLELLTVASHLGYDKILEAPIKLNYCQGFEAKSVHEILRLMKMIWNLFVDTLAIFYRLRIKKYYDQNTKTRKH